VGSLTILEVQAVGLAPKDSNGLSDPFVEIQCRDRDTFVSHVIPKNLAPVWSFGNALNLQSKQSMQESMTASGVKGSKPKEKEKKAQNQELTKMV